MTEEEQNTQNLHSAKTIESKIETVEELKKNFEQMKKTLSCSIDDQILLAELEYRLVQEEMALLSLQQKYFQSAALWDTSQKPDVQAQVCEVLHSYVTTLKEKGAIPALHATEHSAMENSVLVSSQGDKPSVPMVEWAHQDTELQAGDRLLEVNGHSLIGKEPNEVHRILRTGDSLCRVVFLRPLSTYQLLKDTSRKEASNLRQELTSVVGRLNDKIAENAKLKEQLSSSKKDLEFLQKENEKMKVHVFSLENIVFLLYRLIDSGTTNEKLDLMKSLLNQESQHDLYANLSGHLTKSSQKDKYLDLFELTSGSNTCSNSNSETHESIPLLIESLTSSTNNEKEN